VVASLWKVDDDATQVLMRSFYEAWWPHDDAPGVDVFTALRRAQDAVRAHPKWRHPRFWAAWVVWGSPR
jgi:CHAT domain-containing protein